MVCTIATNGVLRNRWQHGPAVPSPGKLQTGSRMAGTCRRKGSTNPMTSRTRDQGTGGWATLRSLDGYFCSECTIIEFWRRTGKILAYLARIRDRSLRDTLTLFALVEAGNTDPAVYGCITGFASGMHRLMLEASISEIFGST